MRIPRVSVLMVIAAAALPSLGRAADAYQVTSSTQFLWYADPLAKDTNQYDLAENLRVSARLDDAGQFRVYGYGRVIWQVSTGAEDQNWFGRLYYLYVDMHDLVKDHLDLRVGRTYVPQAAIAGIVDGAHLDARNLLLPGLGVTAFGGHRATFDEKQEVDNWSDTLWGGSVYLDTALLTHAEFSYARRYTDGDLGREAMALEVSTTPFDFLNAIGRANYDLGSSRWSELMLQANVVPVSMLTVRAQYYASRPTFDKFSFYNFFGVQLYEELGAGVELTVSPRWRFRANYAYEWFDSDAHANLFDVGVTLRPIDPLFLDASYEKRIGYGGGLDGIRFNGSYRIGAATVSAGADFSDFRHDADELAYGQRSGTAKRFWAGAGYDFNKYVGAVARIEDDLNFYFSHALKGFVAVNVNI